MADIKNRPRSKSMSTLNRVFIACSLDGYIADRNGKIDWLHDIPNPEQIDMGYGEFMADTDALIMGRISFETVLSFGIDWPYPKPVFVLSRSLKEVPKELEGRVFLLKGDLGTILEKLEKEGYQKLYIDGGTTIQSFLKEDRIDEMIITTIPVLLGAGSPLFGDLQESLKFSCTHTKLYLDQVVQSHFKRVKD